MARDNTLNRLEEVAARIKEMRSIMGFTTNEMAEKTDVTEEEYLKFEDAELDLPFTFIYKCANVFDIELTDLLEGQSAKLSSYTVTRKGEGQLTAKEDGIEISNLAPLFRNKLSEPYWVRYEYSEQLQNKPIHTTTHSGQEFDLVLSGSLKVQVGNHSVVLNEGDSIYYDSGTPHGMIAVDGKDCVFCAVVVSGEENMNETEIHSTIMSAGRGESLLVEKFVHCKEDENGALQSISFENEDKFNFAFDCVDAVADKYPDKLAMIHVSNDKTEHCYTFKDIKRASAQCANYFKSLGIKKGDKVMLVLKRHYQFWVSILALHKLGAVAIPATNQLLVHDFEYRFNAAVVKAIVCTADGDTAHQVDLACERCPNVELKMIVNGKREGWRSFDEEYTLFSGRFERSDDTACGDDNMIMFFTSGTTGYPKIAAHSYKYALGHFITAKYWHCVERDGLHFTISDTGWVRLSGVSFTDSGCARVLFLFMILNALTRQIYCLCLQNTTSRHSVHRRQCTVCS